MTSVDPTARLAALMRSQVGVLRRQPDLKRSAFSGSAGPSGLPQDRADFASVVAQRMKGIDPVDPQREHKAVRIYLESIILAEFGPGLLGDPAFPVLVDDVHRQMAGDSEVAQALAEAASILLGQAG